MGIIRLGGCISDSFEGVLAVSIPKVSKNLWIIVESLEHFEYREQPYTLIRGCTIANIFVLKLIRWNFNKELVAGKCRYRVTGAEVWGEDTWEQLIPINVFGLFTDQLPKPKNARAAKFRQSISRRVG